MVLRRFQRGANRTSHFLKFGLRTEPGFLCKPKYGLVEMSPSEVEAMLSVCDTANIKGLIKEE